ncbi:MAG: lamin tail domain-containing protein [Chloroflexota bacterium]
MNNNYTQAPHKGTSVLPDNSVPLSRPPVYKRVAAFVLALGMLLLAVTSTTFADDEMVTRFTFGGGAERVQSENIVLRGGMGQPIAAIAQSESGNSQICTGFECGQGALAANTPEDDPSASPTPTPTATEPSNSPTPTPTATEPPSGSSDDVVINEVYYHGDADGDWIELKNIGSSTVDVSQWYWCAKFSYHQLGDNPTLLQGDLSMEPGEIVVLKAWTDLDADGTGSDLGLFKDDPSQANGRPSFDDPNFMVDFVQWGTPEDVGRPDVAVAKGIWAQTSTNPIQYDFVPKALDSQSLALTSSNNGSASVDFANGNPTQGANNPPVTGSTNETVYLPFINQ